jgi:hypothetical protein
MNYIAPEMEIIVLEENDVVATSEPTLEDVLTLIYDEF